MKQRGCLFMNDICPHSISACQRSKVSLFYGPRASIPGEDVVGMSNVTPSRKRLDSWKQIADYLGCTERTAMRYEAKGIPVYRVGGQKKPHQRVFAYADELDHWLHDGGIGVKVDASSEPESAMDASNQAAHHARQSMAMLMKEHSLKIGAALRRK